MDWKQREFKVQDNENYDKLRRSIRFLWKQYIKVDKLNYTETTYLICENLSRIFEENRSQAVVIYDTLFELNKRYGNNEMAQHIQTKKFEYLHHEASSSLLR